MRNQHIHIIGDLSPSARQLVVILKEGLTVEVRHPGRAEENDVLKRKTLALKKNCIAKGPVRVQRPFLQLKVVVPARTENELKVLPAEPVIHALKIIVGLVKHVEHVAAVDQHLAGQISKAFLRSMRVTDYGQLQICIPFAAYPSPSEYSSS